MTSIRIITMVWGKSHVWLASPCIQSLWRRWKQAPTTVICDDSTVPIPDGVDLYNVEGRWRPDLFSDRLRDVLSEISEPVVLYIAVDRFLLHTVPEGLLEDLADYIVERGNVVRVGFTFNESLAGHHSFVETYRGHDIVRCNDPRHCSLVAGVQIDVALFNKSLLYELLQPFWTVWEIETAATEKMLKTRPDLMSVSVWPCHCSQIDMSRTDLSRRTADGYYQWSGFNDFSVLALEDRELLEAARKNV